MTELLPAVSCMYATEKAAYDLYGGGKKGVNPYDADLVWTMVSNGHVKGKVASKKKVGETLTNRKKNKQ